MGLNITISRRRPIVCSECGTINGYEEVDEVDSGGRAWYDVLESIGYYVPPELRTKCKDWYGEDMKLTDAQIDKVVRFLEKESVWNGSIVLDLIAMAKLKGHKVVINADW